MSRDMSRMGSKAYLELAGERLQRRDATSLADFLMSLVQDSGPVGAQVRTFIIGDDIGQTVHSVRRRISGLAVPSNLNTGML